MNVAIISTKNFFAERKPAMPRLVPNWQTRKFAGRIAESEGQKFEPASVVGASFVERLAAKDCLTGRACQ